MMYGSYVVVGIAAFYAVMICCIRNKIRLAIALNQVAASFVTQQPYSLAVPPAQLFFVFAYFTIWIYFTLYIVSYISDFCQTCYIDGDFTYPEAYGHDTPWYSTESGVPGTCTPSGVV